MPKAAGVSLATVDRVLNERPGVHRKTVERVNQAIEKIGFVRNLSAANLARQRSYRFLFVLPKVGDQFLAGLLAQIDEAGRAFASDMVAVDHVQIDESDPHLIANFLTELDATTLDGVAIMAPESPPVRDAIRRLSERGVHNVSFIAGQSEQLEGDFVGIDNAAAGATAGQLLRRFLAPSQGKVLVIADSMQARDSLDRRRGFDRVMVAEAGGLTVLPSLETYGDVIRTRRVIAAAVEAHPDIVGIYVMSAEARTPMAALAQVRDLSDLVIVAHERTPFTTLALQCGQIDAVIAQNPGHLVRSAIRILRARSDQRPPLASQETIRIEILLKENL